MSEGLAGSREHHELAVRRPACRNLVGIVCVEHLVHTREIGSLPIKVEVPTLGGTKHNRAPVRRPDRVSFWPWIEAETCGEPAGNIVNPDIHVVSRRPKRISEALAIRRKLNVADITW